MNDVYGFLWGGGGGGGLDIGESLRLVLGSLRGVEKKVPAWGPGRGSSDRSREKSGTPNPVVGSSHQ